MTVIAYDGKYLATDRQASSAGLISECPKLFQHPKHSDIFMTFEGCVTVGHMLMDWYVAGADPDKWGDVQPQDNDWTRLIVARGQDVYFYSKWPRAVRVTNKFEAWGCGRELAIGAMAAGVGARAAVEVANQHHEGCGFGVDWVSLVDDCLPGHYSVYEPSHTNGRR